MSGFDLTRFMARGMWGHGGRLGISLHGFGDDWVEMALPYSTDLIGDLDLDVSLVWDRTQKPQTRADGTVPEKDDFRLIFGLAYEF